MTFLLRASTLSALEISSLLSERGIESDSVVLGMRVTSNTGLHLASVQESIFHSGSGSGLDSGSGAGLTSASGPTLNLGTFDIQINAGATLAGNAPALAAFNRAALQWENRIADPITVKINADLASLGAGILGSTVPVLITGSYDSLRGPMVADAADEADDAIVASVPTAAGFSGLLPVGFSFTGDIVATKANLKAMGFSTALLDGIAFTTNDATIRFSTNFTFDFDNSDGVTAGQTDFETVAAHEIGHALGFFSFVDVIDPLVNAGTPDAVDVSPLDLFRFEEGTANDPATVAEFATFPRSIQPNVAANTDEIANEWRMSTGRLTGDARQASHWRDDALSGTLIGVMDPSLSTGLVELVDFPDFRALDLIGYEIIPEPGSFLLLAIGVVGIAAARRHRTR